MDDLYRYKGFTLVDITNTGVTGGEPSKERNQQRNWETVQQTLSLRAQLLELNYLGVELRDLNQHSFGINFTGKHLVWTFEFAVEREDIYSFHHDRYGTLKNDFMIAPIILGLDETVTFTNGLFYTSGQEKNIYFMSQLH